MIHLRHIYIQKKNLNSNEEFINKLDNSEIWNSLKNKLVQSLTNFLKNMKKKSAQNHITKTW